MPSREQELYKEKIEVSLDGRQIFYLFFGGAIIATMVFVLGVMVGRRIEARAVIDAGGGPALASDPLAAFDAVAAGDTELAFPAVLRGDTADLGAVDRALEGSAPEALAAPPPGESETESEGETASADGDLAASPAAVESSAGEGDTGGPGKSAVAAQPDAAAPRPAAISYTLQVGSFQSRAEAETLRGKLVAGGHAAVVAEVDLEDKGVWFRVRVGDFGAHDAALAAKKDFESAEHIIAYVTRLKRG